MVRILRVIVACLVLSACTSRGTVPDAQVTSSAGLGTAAISVASLTDACNRALAGSLSTVPANRINPSALLVRCLRPNGPATNASGPFVASGPIGPLLKSIGIPASSASASASNSCAGTEHAQYEYVSMIGPNPVRVGVYVGQCGPIMASGDATATARFIPAGSAMLLNGSATA